MASARSTYRDGQDGDGAAAAAHPFVWVSLRDPSWRPSSANSACRCCWSTAWQRRHDDRYWSSPRAAVRGGQDNHLGGRRGGRQAREIQLVLGDGFVVSVDRDGAVLERVRQDLEAA